LEEPPSGKCEKLSNPGIFGVAGPMCDLPGCAATKGLALKDADDDCGIYCENEGECEVATHECVEKSFTLAFMRTKEQPKSPVCMPNQFNTSFCSSYVRGTCLCKCQK
jgi:hypothetical protein